jgi:DNA-binding response OmpR family regulator
MSVPLAWIVSADPDVRRLIELNLCKRGMRCLAMTTAAECDRQPAPPQVIVLDIDPAAGLGWETATTMRRRPCLASAPLIVIADALPSASQLAALSPAYLVHKPLAVDELLARVRLSLVDVAETQGTAQERRRPGTDGRRGDAR